MSSLRVKGGVKLSGEIRPQGAKNEVLQILCAVLLTADPITIHNIPDIVDVNKLIKLLSNFGVKVNQLGKGLQIEARALDGIIEAFRHTEHSYCVGLQWHPEFLITDFDKSVIHDFTENVKKNS